MLWNIYLDVLCMGNVSAKEKQTKIEWAKFEPGFIRLEAGVTKNLKLANWRQESRFERPGLRFDVLEEDAKPVNKTFSITSRRLIRALRPIIQKAMEERRDAISVSILKTDEGLNAIFEALTVQKSKKQDM